MKLALRVLRAAPAAGATAPPAGVGDKPVGAGEKPAGAPPPGGRNQERR
jgi:hypothetical protein